MGGGVRPGRSPQFAEPARILAYKDDLARTRRPATSNMYLFIIRRFYGWLEENKVRPDITRGVKQFKLAPGHSKDCLTVEQVRRIPDGIDRGSAMGLRDYALVNLMVRTGLREIEVSRATVGDLREESGEPVLSVPGNRTGAWRRETFDGVPTGRVL